MTRLYHNPNARIMTSAAISGKPLETFGADAIFDTPDPPYATFYEQLRALSPAGTDVPAYVTAPSKTAALLDAAPAWLFAPQAVGDRAENLGTATSEVGSYVNGAALGGSAPYDSLATVVLDGVDDYVDTNWATWTNTCLNPIAAVGTGSWTGFGTGTRERVTALPGDARELPAGVNTGLRITSNGGGDGNGVSLGTLEAGKTYTVCAYVYRTETGSGPVRIRIEKTTSVFPVGVAGEITPIMAGHWVKVQQTFTPVETGVHRLRLDQGAGGGPLEFWVTAIVNTLGSVAPPYGPTLGQVASGAAVFQGEAWASECDIGPLARKSARTFIFSVNRSSITTGDTVFGNYNSTSASTLLRGEGNSESVRFYTNAQTGAQKTWTTAMPTGVSFLALTYSDATKNVRLYRNGIPSAAEAVMSEGWAAPDGLLLNTLRLGCWGVNNNPFEGRIGNFAVIPRYLTEAEVLGIYNGTG
jgi:hypothetical protein